MGNFNNGQIGELLEKASIGWWTADFAKQQYTCSGVIIRMLGLGEEGTISFEDFHKLIHPDYLQRSIAEFNFGKTQDVYDYIYPLQTVSGMQWVRSKLCSRETDEAGISKTYGFLEFLSPPPPDSPGLTAAQGLDSLFNRQEGIPRSLSPLCQPDAINTTIKEMLEEIRAEKQSLDNLYRHMPIGYIRLQALYDGQGRIHDYILKDANNMFLSIVGMPAAHIGRRASETGFAFEKTIPNLEAILERGEVCNCDYHLEKLQKHCNCIGYTPQEDEVVFLITDITENYNAHQALDHSERLLRNIYRKLPAGLELYDAQGYLIDINDREMEIFGLAGKEAVMGINIFENPIMPEEMKEKLRKSEDADFFLHYDFDQLNGYYQSSKNGKVDILTKATTLHDAQNNLTNYLLINIDRTEATVASNKIQEFKDFFSLVGKFAKVGYAHFDALTCNGYAISSWYRNVGEEEGTPLPQIINVYRHFHPEDRLILLNFLSDVIQGKTQSLRRDVRILRRDGSIGWTRINMIVRNYCPEQNIIEMLCINYDLTELKDIEAKLIQAKEHAEDADRLKSAFIANMSHEIRTPLNAIVGFSSIIAETENPEERAEYQEIVDKNNELLLQLISDILDLSKIEAGILDMNLETVDINELCANTVKTLQGKTPKEVRLLFRPGSPHCLIKSDRKRIRQVLNNFINNAQKFTKQGEIILAYYFVDKQIEVSVSDTGIGISPEDQKRVFQRFVKFNAFVPGSGLGLSICQSIIQQLGGKIGVESEEGKGSRFWFRLPV